MSLFGLFSKKQEMNIPFVELRPGEIIEFTLCESFHDYSARFTRNELKIRKFSGIIKNIWKEPQTKIWMAEVVSVQAENETETFVRTFSLHEHEIEKMRLLK